jgi:anti-sigma factor RsiW
MSTSEALQEYSCQELVELVTDYLEDAMTPYQRASFEAHLAACTGCRNYVGQVRATVHALERLPDPPVAPEVRDSLLDIFRKWKNSDGDP